MTPDSSSGAGPDRLEGDDTGGDTARRYRFQWTYAALSCCQLLDDTEDTEEVFCEQHEDVLLRHADGSFSGLQIKSRESSQEAWKTRFDEIRRSLARFASLEHRFPGRFRSFHFLTNHPLFGGSSGQNLRLVLETIRAAATAGDVAGPSGSVLGRAAKDANCTVETAFAALKKATAADDLPKLADGVVRLGDTLSQVWDGAETCTYSGLMRAADALISECGKASSLAHLGCLPGYLPGTRNPVQRTISENIRGKRFDRDRVLKVLERGLDASAPLFGDPASLSSPDEGTTELMRRKLEAGGFSAVAVNSADDLKAKSEALAIRWQKRDGALRGLQRYSHIRSLVMADAADAHDATAAKGDPFGRPMLAELRRRIATRRRNGGALFDASDEHLEGFAYGLTAQCKVLWSHARPWQVE